jgi:tetratricopeptide (TPR) repeat protein
MCSRMNDANLAASEITTVRRRCGVPGVRRPQKFSAMVCLLLFLGLGFAGSAPATSQTSEEVVIEHFRAGQQALKDGEFDRAAKEFNRVLAQDPTLLEAEVNLGLAYHSLCQYELAVRHLAKALHERPNLPGPNLIVGMDYLKLGSPAKALPFLQQALRLDPGNRDAHRALASSYLGQGDFRRAGEEYRQIAVLDPDKPQAWFKLGHDYLDLSAHLAYRGAHLYRDSAWGYRFLGDLLFQRSRWDDAAEEYRKAVRLDHAQSGLHTSLGQALLHAAKLEEAESEFHLELGLDPRNELAWLGLAEKHLAKGEAVQAEEAVGKVWNISPEFLLLQRDFPTDVLPQETGKALVEKFQGFPDTAAKHFLLATLYSSRGESQAEEYWKSLQADFVARQKVQNPINAAKQEPCHAHRYADCLHSLLARKSLTDAQRLMLGESQFALGQYDRAANALGGVRGVTKENVEASYWLARSYHALGAEAYGQLEESFPNSWRNHQLLGEGFAFRQDLDNAVKEFQLALQLHPDSSELHEALGEAFLDNHSDDDARRELEATLRVDPSSTHALYLLGRLYVQKRENEKAVTYLQKALQLQPDLVDASILLGTAYVRLGQFDIAVPKLQQAATVDFYGNVHYQLFVAYRSLGQSQLAQQALARSQELRRSSLEHDQAVIMGVRPSDRDPQ